jgi:hypothetical protein
MFALGKPLGWSSRYKDNIPKQILFIEKMDLPILEEGTKYGFMDVIESLVLI